MLSSVCHVSREITVCYECSSVLVPTITNTVNLSLTSGEYHPTLKESVISPLLKKKTLDKEELSNCWPISNLLGSGTVDHRSGAPRG